MLPRPLHTRRSRLSLSVLLCVCCALLLAMPLGRSAAQTGDIPRITTHPKSAGVLYGQRVTLTVVAEGATEYQWYTGSSDDPLSAPLLGKTESTFVSEPLFTTARYWVRVSNQFGSVDSFTARIEIESEPPGIYTTRLPVVRRFGPAFPGE